MRHLTWWPLIAWRCSVPCHQIPPDWRMYNKWQPTAITLWCSSVIYQQHHNVMISACHQPVNGIGVYTVVARWSSWPWPPVGLHVWHRVLSFAQFLRRAAPGSAGWMPEATSCGRNWQFALIFSREMSPFSRCTRRRLAEGVIRADNQRWPLWWRGNVPRCTVRNGDGHISVLSGALRDVWQIHCGTYKTGLLLLLFDRSVQIVLRYLQYWYL